MAITKKAVVKNEHKQKGSNLKKELIKVETKQKKGATSRVRRSRRPHRVSLAAKNEAALTEALHVAA